jgi:MaoC like domain
LSNRVLTTHHFAGDDGAAKRVPFAQLFNQMSGDLLHYDETGASASRFGEIIVQGWVTTSILNAVATERLPGCVRGATARATRRRGVIMLMDSKGPA